MHVTLLAYTPTPEQTVAMAAKLCYSSKSIGALRDGLTEEKTNDFLDMLSDMGHESPIEHASFTFGIEGVSRSLLAQITRHRIASFSVKSQRYVHEGAFAYVTPPAVAEDAETRALFQEAMEAAQRYYDRLSERLAARHAAALTARGVPEKQALRQAEKLANEDARFVLPNACDTQLVVTMNARSLLNFFSLRCCNRAQWEIRAVADEMLRLCRSAAPHLFAKAGPPCLRGDCPEGGMSCGKAGEVRARYAALSEPKTEREEAERR